MPMICVCVCVDACVRTLFHKCSVEAATKTARQTKNGMGEKKNSFIYTHFL